MRFFTSDHHFFHRNIMRYEATHRPFSSLDEMHDALISYWNQTVRPEDEVYYLGDFALSSSARSTSAILDKLNGVKYLIRGNHDRESLGECFQWSRSEYELELSIPNHSEPLSVRLCHYPYIDRDLLHMREAEVLRYRDGAPRLDSLFQRPLSEILGSAKSYDEQRSLLTKLYGLEVATQDREEAQPLCRSLRRALKRFTWGRPRPDGRWLLHGHVHSLWRSKPLEHMVNVSVEAWGLRPVSEQEIIQEILSAGTNERDGDHALCTS